MLSVLHGQGILVQMSHLDSFPGSLNNVSKVEFAKAQQEDPEYNDLCKYELSLEENNVILRLLNSNQFDLEGSGLQKALTYLMCLTFMLRGAGEIHSMLWTKVVFGVYGLTTLLLAMTMFALLVSRTRRTSNHFVRSLLLFCCISYFPVRASRRPKEEHYSSSTSNVGTCQPWSSHEDSS